MYFYFLSPGMNETMYYLNDHMYYLDSIFEFIKVSSTIEHQSDEKKSVKMTLSHEGSNQLIETQKTPVSSNRKTESLYKYSQ